MAINSVTSSTSASAQQVRSQKQPEPAPQAKRADAARVASQNHAKAQVKDQVQAKPHAEAPKPVVNTQGQRTGTIVNTTA